MAVNDVASSSTPGRIHAVIGPNGAGKTTLTNLLSGDLPASAGRYPVRGRGHRATARPIGARDSAIGRSYQKTNIFLPFTAFENCRLAAQSRMPRALHVASGRDWRYRRRARRSAAGARRRRA